MVAEFITPNYNLFVTMKKPNKIKRTTVAGSKKKQKKTLDFPMSQIDSLFCFSSVLNSP